MLGPDLKKLFAEAHTLSQASLNFKTSNPLIAQKTNWVIGFGTVSSGKTAQFEYFKAHEPYACHGEIARPLIKTVHEQTGRSVKEITRDPDFQYAVMLKVLERESRQNPSEIQWFERGAPDTVAYLALLKQKALAAMRYCQQFKYGLVICLDRLPLVNDSVRLEEEKEADLLYRVALKTYRNLGYDIAHIPAFADAHPRSINARKSTIVPTADGYGSMIVPKGKRLLSVEERHGIIMTHIRALEAHVKPEASATERVGCSTRKGTGEPFRMGIRAYRSLPPTPNIDTFGY